MEDYDSFIVEDLRVRIVYDEHPRNPREEFSSLGTMVCWHNRHNLGDKHHHSSPDDFREAMKDEPHISLPLYLYDHSGITMSTGPFHCPWDSGQVGWIYITLADVRKEYGWKLITKKRRQKISGYLTSEVAEYDAFLTGQVHGFIVEDPDGNHLDSCFGYYGEPDYVKQEGTESAKYFLAQRASERATAKVTADAMAAFNASAPF